MLVSAPVGRKPPEQETGHWYDRAGLPCYQQTTAKGALRGTDVRDARKLGLVPSVTTVLSVLAKDALTNWKVRQAILSALTLTRREGESDDDFLSRVLTDSKAQAKAAAEEGTRIHDAIEDSFKGRPVPNAYRRHVDGVHAKLIELFPDVTDWVAEKSFACPLGFGGKCDIHSPSTGLTGDHKGKDGDFSDGKRLAYDQHFQLAPYQVGLCLPTAPGFNLFVSRTHPGAVAHKIWPVEKMQEGWRVFEAALETWKRLKGFDSSFDLAPHPPASKETGR